MSDITTAFWGMTINNYDDTDLALVKQGYPDYIRQIVYTLEKGESGTPHIQAYIKLFRQQRLSYVKKLFPRGNFKALCVDEYKLNAQRYAQKLDETAQSPAIINNNPFPDAVNELLSVIEGAYQWYGEGRHQNHIKEKEWLHMLHLEQMNRVREKPHLAKFYISAQYKTLIKEYFWSFVSNVFEKKNSVNTHTHTHSDEKFSHAEDITEDGEDSEESEGSVGEESEQSEDLEGDQEGESETSSTDDQSWSSRSSEALTL